MFTIGRNGELVVRVMMVRDSPLGRSVVSSPTLNVTDSPGAATGMLPLVMSVSEENVLLNSFSSNLDNLFEILSVS